MFRVIKSHTLTRKKQETIYQGSIQETVFANKAGIIVASGVKSCLKKFIKPCFKKFPSNSLLLHSLISKGTNHRNHSIRGPCHQEKEENGKWCLCNPDFYRCCTHILVSSQRYNIHFTCLFTHQLLMSLYMSEQFIVEQDNAENWNGISPCEDCTNKHLCVRIFGQVIKGTGGEETFWDVASPNAK